jgi:hypothetical protein
MFLCFGAGAWVGDSIRHLAAFSQERGRAREADELIPTRINSHGLPPRLGELLRLQVKRNGLSLLPRARPFWPVLRIDELAAEALSELFGVHTLREAEDVDVDAVAVKRMAAVAQG